MRGHYGFHCECPVCELQGEGQIVSDSRRNRMTTIRNIDQFERGEIGADQVIRAVKEIIGLMDKEGLIPGRGVYYADAMQVSAHHSDSRSTKHFANLTAVSYELETGRNSEISKQIRILEKGPWRHPSWGKGENKEVEY